MNLHGYFKLWEIILTVFTAIMDFADFLYSVIEPFIVIIFTIFYAVNPPLAVLFITFALILRFLSMIDLEGNESYTNNPCSLLIGQQTNTIFQ